LVRFERLRCGAVDSLEDEATVCRDDELGERVRRDRSALWISRVVATASPGQDPESDHYASQRPREHARILTDAGATERQFCGFRGWVR